MGIPHSTLDNPHFRSFLQSYESIKLPYHQKIPSAYQHRKKVKEIGDKIFKKSLEILATQNKLVMPTFVTLAIDGWTGHTYGGKNTNILALYKEQSILLWSDRNDNDNDAVDSYLFPLVSKQITYLLRRGVMVVAVTTDNASNMISLGSQLYQIKPQGSVILHISCSAHTIQLMIAKIVELNPLRRFITESENLLEAFTTTEGKRLRLELRNHQRITLANTNPLKLLFLNATRWLSRLASLERLVKLKGSIMFVANNGGSDYRLKIAVAKNELWWTHLSTGVIPLIKQFALATNIVQSDRANLFDLQGALRGFRNSILNNNLSDVLGVANSTEESFQRRAVKIIDEYITSYIASTDHHAYRAVGLISDSYEILPANSSRAVSQQYFATKDATEKWMAEWGADLIMFYKDKFSYVRSTGRTVLMGIIKKQLVMFNGGVHDFASKAEDMKLLVRKISANSFSYDEKDIEKEETDWKLFWVKYYDRTPELAAVALCLLSIGISEATVERSFSIQKLTHNDIRNRLAADIVEAEMRIRFNKSISNSMMELLGNDDRTGSESDEPTVEENIELSDEDEIEEVHEDANINAMQQ